MTVGDIVWVELPPGDGREQGGRRRAVVFQDESFAGLSPVVLVIPLTTALAATRFPGTVLIQTSVENGLRQPSVALVFQMRGVDRRRFHERLGSLSPEAVAQLHFTLDRLTGRHRDQ